MSSPNVRNLRIFFTSARKALHGLPSRRNDPCMTGTDMGCEKASGGGYAEWRYRGVSFLLFRNGADTLAGALLRKFGLLKF